MNSATIFSACGAMLRNALRNPSSYLNRWLFSILHPIWPNEVRAQHLRQGQGCMAAEELGDADNGEQPVWFNEVMRHVSRLPSAQHNSLFLVYGLSYREAAKCWRPHVWHWPMTDSGEPTICTIKESHPPPFPRTRR
ncbi:hypothetical protein NFX37_25270 [Serratia marcescens]|nr:hypothetical protein NFX37_25270 [Serratia marcescens]